MTNPSVRDLVDLALLPLKAVDGGLHARAVDYVVDGAHPQVLGELAGHGRMVNDCLQVAGTVYHYFDDALLGRLKAAGIPFDYRRGRSVRTVFALRDPLYRDGALSAPQWARLGRLLDRARRTDPDWTPSTPEPVPDWFDALVMDAVATIVPPDDGSDTVRELARDHRPGWDAGRLSALLLEEGVDAADITPVLFLEVFADASGRVVHLPGVIDRLTERARQIPARLLDELSHDRRIAVMRFMAHDVGLARAGAHLLAALSAAASKKMRRQAVALLADLDPQVRNAAIAPVLAKAPASRAVELVEFLASADDGAQPLDAARRDNRRLADLIARTRARRDTLAGQEAPIEVPPFTPIEIGPDAAPVKAELRAALDRLAGRTDADARQDSWIRKRVDDARRITDADLDALVAVADGKSRRSPEFLRRFSVHWIAGQAPSLTFAHALRLHCAEKEPSPYWWYRMTLGRYMDPDTDPRAVEELMARTGCDCDSLVEGFSTYVFQEIDPRVSWPWFVGRPERLREALGESDSTARALEIVGAMPRVPAELLAVVADIAVGDSKVNRPLAQAVLRSHSRVRVLAEQALGERRAETRASAAAWVGSLGDRASVPALEAAVRAERKDVVRAALLAALGECGGDLGEFLSPRVLGAEAARGLTSKAPASLAAWFDFDSLPAVHWSNGDGEPADLVDPDIIRWWVVLADRLKNPNGRGIIALYLSLLEAADAAALAGCVVRAWIARDTRHPDPEESRAHAQAAGRWAYDHAQQWLESCRRDDHFSSYLPRAEAEAAVTVEEHIAAAYAEHQRTYAGSAVADKGLVAFAVGMDDGELAELVRAYMRANPGRRAQFEVLVRALYANGGRQALQVLLSIARRHKMAGIQATAAALVREIASERGWSDEELADRTVPAAGFDDDDGLLRLSYGEREFTGRLTPDLKIRVTGPDGRSRAGLPAPRAGEDAEVVKAAKKRLSAARKEAKTVLSLQTERLYEAMCASRTWPAVEWRELLACHPLVGRLVTRLIWTTAPAAPADPADSAPAAPAAPADPAAPGAAGPTPPAGGPPTFRPTEDGELLGADDAVVELDERARVGLAHGTLLSSEAVAAWRQHLADYGVEPLFDQLSAVVPRVAEGQKEMRDLQGHMTDSFTLRGAALKRGYKRGEVMDAGFFDAYVKDFAALGLTAVLGFTGACLPEEKIPCATTSLSFTRRGCPVPLDRVPPVLLAECRADYAALAALGPYDPDWKKKAFM